jgi:hypothetical protein
MTRSRCESHFLARNVRFILGSSTLIGMFRSVMLSCLPAFIRSRQRDPTKVEWAPLIQSGTRGLEYSADYIEHMTLGIFEPKNDISHSNRMRATNISPANCIKYSAHRRYVFHHSTSTVSLWTPVGQYLMLLR